jgi:Flp pilus assembly protein TadG
VKRAAFRLQPVLELRRTEERAAAAAAAQAASAAADSDRRATEYERTLAAAVLPRSLPAGQFLATMTLLRTAATDASDARALATASASSRSWCVHSGRPRPSGPRAWSVSGSDTGRRSSMRRTPPRSGPSTTS